MIEVWLLLGSNRDAARALENAIERLREQGAVITLGPLALTAPEPPAAAGGAAYANQAVRIATDEGLDELRARLKTIEQAAGPREDSGVPLDIDLVLATAADGRVLHAAPRKYAPAYAKAVFAGLLTAAEIARLEPDA